MATERLFAFFTKSGVPEAGLSPVMNIWDSADAHVVTNGAMTAMTQNGFYYYDFASYDPDKIYLYHADGGVTLSNYERYVVGTNEIQSSVEGISDDITLILEDTGTTLPSTLSTMDGKLDGIKTQTDKLTFTGSDIKATLDGEKVIVTSNEDKTDYVLTTAYDAAKNAASQSSVNTIDVETDKIQTIDDNLDTLKAEIEGSLPGLISLIVTNLDTTVSSRLAGSSYTAPDNTGIGNIKTQTDKIQVIDDNIDLIKTDITRIKDIEEGRWKIEANQMIFYKPDNITELFRFNLFDSLGTPTMINVADRSRV